MASVVEEIKRRSVRYGDTLKTYRFDASLMSFSSSGVLVLSRLRRLKPNV